MSEVLERAAIELIARPPREAPAVHELRRRLNRRRGRRSGVVGVVGVVLMVVGLVAVSGRSTPDAVGDRLEELGFDNDGTTPCGDYGCGQFDPIAVAPGVDDFYVGPASLGDPFISEQFWNATLRCAQLDASGTMCTRIEGLGGVALVSYGSDADQIQVGTTFSPNVSVDDYAKGLGIGPRATTPAVSATTVRGHPAAAFSSQVSTLSTVPLASTAPTILEDPTAGFTGLMWEERPDVIVWVVVPTSRQTELTTIAEGLQTYAGPTSIPGRLVVPDTGVPWGVGTSGNNGSGLVIARFQGRECVAWGYIDSCDDGIDARTFVNLLGPDTAVAGSVPPEVDSVRVVPQFGQAVEVTPFSYAGFTGRFYQALLPQDYATSIEWLAADGNVVATHDVDNDAQAGWGGWPVARAQVNGRAVQLTADIDTTGQSPDPSIGVGKYVGNENVAESLLCTYITLFGPSAVTCSVPEQLNVWDGFDGIVFGAAGPDVASVVVDGQTVELHASPEILDRRFFVAAGTEAVFIDSAGNDITVPPPIDRQQNP